MELIVYRDRKQYRLCEMNKMKKSATGPISPEIVQKKQFNLVPVKPKSQEDKPWKTNNSSLRNAVSISKVDSNLQRNDIPRLVKVNRLQSLENGRPAPDNVKVSFSLQSEDLSNLRKNLLKFSLRE